MKNKTRWPPPASDSSSALHPALLVCAALALSVGGCEDYDEGQPEPTPILVNVGGSFSGTGKSDAGGTGGGPGIVTIDTWQPPAADVGAPDSLTDAGRMPQSDVIWWDTAEAGPRQPADVGTSDSSVTEPDADFDTVDGAEAEDVEGPLPDVNVPPTDTSVEDAPPTDSFQADTLVDIGMPDSGPTDTFKPDTLVDIGMPDSGPADTSKPDVVVDIGMPDSGPTDTPKPDVVVDIGMPDSGPTDTSNPDVVADAVMPDAVVDAGPPDVVVDSGPKDVVDAAWNPDWLGYPETNFPDGADIHGPKGLDSCFWLYIFVIEEGCVDADLTVPCIDENASKGSLWGQYLFKPLRKCMVANCVPKCTGPKSKDCLDQCRAKHCAYPLFACFSEGENGNNDCPDTFACMQKYEGKFVSMSSQCFGTASPSAKKQLAEFIGCSAKPQTDSCFDQIASCYGPAGNLTCSETIKCSDACPKPDGGTCGFECIGKADADAQKKLDVLWDCIIAKCQGQGDACISQKCLFEYTDCLNDKAGAP